MSIAPQPKTTAHRRPLRRYGLLLLAVVAAVGSAATVGWLRQLPGLAQWAQTQANAQIKGELRIGKLQWQPPLGLRIEQVSLFGPADAQAALLRIGEAQAQLSLSGLWRGEVGLSAVQLTDVEVQVRPAVGAAGDADPYGPWREALAPRTPPAPKSEDPPLWQRLSLRVDAARLQQLRLEAQLPGGFVHLEGLEAQIHGRFATDAAQMQGDMQLGSGLWQRASLAAVALPRALLEIDDCRWQTQPGQQGQFSCAQLAVQLGDAYAQTQGHGSWQNDVWHAQAQAQAGFAAAGILQQLGVMPQAAKSSSNHGSAAVNLQLQFDGKPQAPWHGVRAQADWQAQGQQLCVAGVGADASLGQVLWQDNLLRLTHAQLRADGGQVDASGEAILSDDNQLQRHDIVLHSNKLPLAKLLRSWQHAQGERHAANPWVPKELTLQAQLHGEQAWPAPSTRLQLQAVGLQLAKMPALTPARLQTTVALDHGNLAVEELRVALADGSHLNAAGEAPGRAQAPWSAQLAARVPALAAIAQAAHLPLDGDDIVLELEIGGSRAQPLASGTIKAQALRVAVGEQTTTLGQVNIPWQLQANQLRVTDGRLDGPQGKARLDGSVRWPVGQMPDGNSTLAGEMRIHDLALRMPDAERALVQASAVASGTLAHPQTQLFASVHTDGGAQLPAAHAAALLRASPQAVALQGLAAHIGPGGILWALGDWQQSTGGVSAVLDGRALPLHRTDSQTHASALPIDLHVQAIGSSQDFVRLDVQSRLPDAWANAQAIYRAAAGSLDSRVQAHASLAGLAPLLPQLQTARALGELDVDLQTEGPWALPRISGQAALTQPSLAGQALAAERVDMALSMPEPQHWRLQAQSGKTDALRGQLDLQRDANAAFVWSGQLESFEAADFWPPLQQAEASLRLAANMRGSYAAGPGVAGDFVLTRLDASVKQDSLHLEAPSTLALADGRVSLDKFRLQGSAGRLALAGSAGTQLDLSGDGRLQLGFLLPLLPGLRYAKGELTWQARAKGTWKTPDAEAELRILTPVTLAVRGMPTELLLRRGLIRVNPQQLLLDDVAGALEGGSFAVHGEAVLHQYQPQHFGFSLQGDHLPLHADNVLIESNVALSLAGTPEQSELRGDIDITQGRYLRKFELHNFKFSGNNKAPQAPLSRRFPWLASIMLDVRAKNKGGFDVSIDAGAFAIRTSLESDLHVGGNVLKPALNGKINATTGSLQFPHGTLSLHQASIDFDSSRRSHSNSFGTEVSLLADGEITPSSSQASQNYDIILGLNGSLDQLALELESRQNLGRLEILSLLTTGYANISDATQGGDDQAKRDAALAFAGSQISEPMTRLAQKALEQQLNLRVELGAEVTNGNVRVTAAKNLHRRLRVETAYSHGMTAQQSAVSTRARLTFTDRLLLEGQAARDLTGGAAASTSQNATQGKVELKLRLIGH